MSNPVVCRACLITDVKMYEIVDGGVKENLQIITGISINNEDGKPKYLCYVCTQHLKRCVDFRERCLRSEEVLTGIQTENIQITEDEIKLIDRTGLNLTSNLYKTTLNTAYITFFTPAMIKEETELRIKCEGGNNYDDDADDNVAGNDSDDAPSVPSDDDSEDDIPLKQIHVAKLKDEDSLPRKKRRRKPAVDPKEEEAEAKRGFTEDYADEVYLTREQQLDEMKERAKSLNYINSPYKCMLCYRGFVDRVAFDKHREKHDKSAGTFECDICHLRYSVLRQLRTHLATSHTRLYVCKKCTNRSHTANQAREHEKWHKGYVYQCQLCGETFRKTTSHLTHMRKHHPTEFICEVCGASFVGKHGLRMHRVKTHKLDGSKKSATRNPDSYCTDCKIQFVSVDAWRTHVTSYRHGDDNSCKICKQRLESSSALQLHMKEHSKQGRMKADKCEVPKVDVKMLSCDVCGSEYVNKSKLQAHVRRTHLGLKYNKNIVCEVCGKKCTSFATLKYHQRTHTGERPFSCQDCPKRFSDNNQLKIHFRTHTDERPYSCLLCVKTFRQKPALNRHMRVHTGVKPYGCQYCSKSFSQSNSLKLHIRTVHLKLPPNRKSKVNGSTVIVLPVLGKSETEDIVTLQTL